LNAVEKLLLKFVAAKNLQGTIFEPLLNNDLALAAFAPG
jgi:hypothetical protein